MTKLFLVVSFAAEEADDRRLYEIAVQRSQIYLIVLKLAGARQVSQRKLSLLSKYSVVRFI